MHLPRWMISLWPFQIPVTTPTSHSASQETRQDSNMRQEHLWPISAQSWEGKGQHPRGPLLSRRAVISTGLRDARPALRRGPPRHRLSLTTRSHNIRPSFLKNLNCGSSLNMSVWRKVDLDSVLITILSAPRGRTAVSIGQDFENSNHLYNLPPLSPPSRTWSRFKKHFGRVLSRCGPGPSPGFAGLSDPPPVLLAQFVGQPARTTGIRTASLEFSGTHASQSPFAKTYQWFKCKES